MTLRTRGYILYKSMHERAIPGVTNPRHACGTRNVTIYMNAELILQPFRHFTYVTAHFPTLPSLYLRHSSFSNPSFASPGEPSMPETSIQAMNN